MKSNAVRRIMVAAVLMAATAFGAFAADTGTTLPAYLTDYIQAKGVEVQYLNMTEKQVPADQWAKITDLAMDARFVTLAEHYLRGELNALRSGTMKVGPATYTECVSNGNQYISIQY